MNSLSIEGTDETPRVVLDKSAGVFEISGRSLPEDSVDFYEPVMNWLKEYAKAPNAATEFSFKLDYFNTSSSKLILDILRILNDIKGVTIAWYSFEDDEEVAEAGQEFSEQVELPFVFKTM